MNSLKITELEKKMDAGTEIEKAYLNDYFENKPVPAEYLAYCQAWERACDERERIS